MMKILHLCLGCFYVDGYSYQENILSRYHVKMGYDVTIIASLFTFGCHGEKTYLDNPSQHVTKDGVKVIRLAYKNPQKLNKVLVRYQGLKDRLEEEDPDVIFIHGAQSWDVHTVVRYLRHKNKIKVFVDNHGDWHNSGVNWISRNIKHKILWKHCMRLIEPYTTKFFGVLPIRCDFLHEMYGIPQEKIEYLPLGVDDMNTLFSKRDKIRGDIRQELNILDDDFVITSGGKLRENYQLFQLINAFKKVKKQKTHLLLFGVVTKDIEERFKNAISDANIHFVGWVNSLEIYKYIFASDLVVFPGLHSVLWEEVVGLGTPAIFRRLPGTEHVNIGGNCEFLEESSEDEIADVFSKILNNSDFFNNMKSVAESDKRKKFYYSEIARQAIGLQ